MPYPTLTPAAYLAEALSPHPAELTLLSGESGCGKTTWCQDLVEKARQAGIQPVGLLSPAVFHVGVKVGIDLMNIDSGDTRRLAAKRIPRDLRSEQGVQAVGWHFDLDVFAWGNRILARQPASRLLILDEVGPVEFLFQKGLLKGVEIIDARQYQAACVVVRPSLLTIATRRWPWAQVIQVEGNRREGRSA